MRILKEKSWIFQTSFKDWAKYFFNRLFSSRYVIKGKCKQCTQCCLNILFSDENGYIKDKDGFERLKKRKVFYKQFYIAGVSTEDDATKDALLFGCKHLRMEECSGETKGRCSIYFFRPLFCRDYPAINYDFVKAGGVTLDGCGYSFGVDKEFMDYLK